MHYKAVIYSALSCSHNSLHLHPEVYLILKIIRTEELRCWIKPEVYLVQHTALAVAHRVLPETTQQELNLSPHPHCCPPSTCILRHRIPGQGGSSWQITIEWPHRYEIVQLISTSLPYARGHFQASWVSSPCPVVWGAGFEKLPYIYWDYQTAILDSICWLLL